MDIEWVIYHLIHDDEEFERLQVDVDYCDDDVWIRLLAGLRRNSHVIDLSMSRAEIPEARIRTPDELEECFEHLGQLPYLTNVQLVGFSASDLECAIPTLCHPAIRTVRLDVAAGDLSREVLLAMASAQNLREVHLEVTSSAPLALLLRSESLVSLTLETYGAPLAPQHWSDTADALKSNSSLKFLDMDYKITIPTLLVQVIHNNTTMQKLSFATDLEGSLESRDEQTRDIFKALQNHPSLQHVRNYLSWKLVVSPDVQNEQIQMLGGNFDLQELSLFREEPTIEKKRKMYLSLNKVGRKKLLRHDASTKEDWIEAVSQTSDDLNCLFYLFTANPSLCKVGNLSLTSVSPFDDLQARQAKDSETSKGGDTDSPTPHTKRARRK